MDARVTNSPTSSRERVARACQRCRWQKLKDSLPQPSPVPRVVESSASPSRRQMSNNDTNQPWKSSSTRALVDGAFKLHEVAAPEITITDAIPGAQQQGCPTDSRAISLAGKAGPNAIPATMRLLPRSSRIAVLEPRLLLSKQEAAALLVDKYFDQVHWFMLIFHRDEFRRRWKDLYSLDSSSPMSPCLMVIAIGLQYAGPHRRHLLADHNVSAKTLSLELFSAIQAKLLDILLFGSLEAVQTCVLLGAYYHYHGSPGLAWPVCGCGLRTTQALNLHRKLPKSCWWAIYEIETFYSMSYGYPHRNKDVGCDVEPLDPSRESQVVLSPKIFDAPLTCGATLLSYKYFMSKLPKLINSALAELYRVGSNSTETSPPTESATRIHRPVEKVAELGTTEISLELQVDSHSGVEVNYSSVEELELDISGCALVLELAYDNARIIVHRPLLSYRLVSNSRAERSDPFRSSLQACREAALSTSEVALIPLAELVSSTYAAAFVGIHALTAGITLGILISLDPLSQESYMAKNGLHQLISMQSRLKTILDVGKPANPTTHVTDASVTADTAVDTERYSQRALQGVAGQSNYGQKSCSPGPETSYSLDYLDDCLYYFESAEGPALSQAVYDFDQAPPLLEWSSIGSSLIWPSADDFPVLEQA
ncbi:hypothetical protein BJX70DRAFT_392636 [Aspergillus crustosus]